MTVIATITTSVDGYVTGPDDGPATASAPGASASTTHVHYAIRR
jgi:hypothetical protein